jgi:hypothetical protein
VSRGENTPSRLPQNATERGAGGCRTARSVVVARYPVLPVSSRHWSGTLPTIMLFVSETGLVANMPPACNVIAALPLRAFPVTRLLMSVSRPPGVR